MKKKILTLVIGFAILLTIQLLSNCLINLIHVGLPSPILGLGILAVLLYFRILPEKLIKDISDLLLGNMALFFIPLFVGMVSYAHLIRQNLLPILLTVVFTTFFTMLVTAFFVEYVIKITTKGEEK